MACYLLHTGWVDEPVSQEPVATALYGEIMDYSTILAERRKFPRFPICLPVEYSRLSEYRRRAGVVADISRMGVQFHSVYRIVIGTELRITVLFPLGYELTTLDIAARVVWRERHPGTDWSGYKYGLKFTRISEKDQLKLDFFLNAHLSVDLSTNEISNGLGGPEVSEVGESYLFS
jgi:hypothetical protein